MLAIKTLIGKHKMTLFIILVIIFYVAVMFGGDIKEMFSPNEKITQDEILQDKKFNDCSSEARTNYDNSFKVITSAYNSNQITLSEYNNQSQSLDKNFNQANNDCYVLYSRAYKEIQKVNNEMNSKYKNQLK